MCYTIFYLIIHEIELFIKRILVCKSLNKFHSLCLILFNIINKKSKVEGVCDLCGGKTVIRKDDQPATVLDRLKAYHEQTEPLVAFYRERGKLAVIPFCPSIEETTAEVMKALEA